MAGTALAIYSYHSDPGINHTDGALLVIGTTLIIWIAALALGWARRMWSWLRRIIMVVLLINIIGTGVAGWFLEIEAMMAFMAFAMVGWLAHALLGRGRLPHAEQRIAS